MTDPTRKRQLEELDQVTLCARILLQARSELYVNMKFLDVSLSSLGFEADWAREGLGTDGHLIYYGPDYLLGLYKRGRTLVNRGYLHMLFHCLFCHMYTRKDRDKGYWDLSCDIAMEYVIDGLYQKCVHVPRSALRREIYLRLEKALSEKGPVLTAERVYRALLEMELPERRLDMLKAEFFVVLKEEDPIFAFNKAIIDATADLCIAYKPNLAFYESMGVKGWIAFEKTVKYIKDNYPDQFIIADAKRGDIGNTSAMYARTFFEELDIDSVTVAPYMGEDSVTPFLTYEGKWVILLALTSNKGSHDFQLTEDVNGERLFEKVLRKSQEWAGDDRMMYVVGATQGRAFEDIRKIVPNHFLLVPGVGAQGGSLEEVCKYGMNSTCGLIVNSSRGIIYVDKTEKFAEAARTAAQEVQAQMAEQLKAIL